MIYELGSVSYSLVRRGGGRHRALRASIARVAGVEDGD